MTQQHNAIYLYKKHSNGIAKRLLLIITLFTSTFCIAQTESPLIKNYSGKEYGASVSNFEVVQDTNGILYYANFDGVLTFDGNNWDLIEIANGKTAYSLALQNNRLFIGSHNEMGFIEWNNKGVPKYKSLTENSKDKNFGVVFKIVPHGNKIYFNTREKLLEYSLDQNSDNLRYWKTNNESIFGKSAFIDKEKLFIHKGNEGLFTLNNDSLKLGENGEIMNQEFTAVSLRKNDSTYLIGRSSGELYKNPINLTQSNTFGDSIKSLIQNSVATTASFYNNIIAMGTLRNGILGIDNNRLIFHLNELSGLHSNNIRSVHLDNSFNLWAATRNGITKINNISKWSHWNSTHGLDGNIDDIINYNNQVFISTSKGIFVQKNGGLKKTDSIDQRSHSFFLLNNDLLVSTEHGIYDIEKKFIIKELPYPTHATTSDENELFTHLVLGGLAHYKYNKNNSTFEDENIIDTSAKGFISNSLTINNSYWFSIKNSGVFQYNLSRKSKVIKFTEGQGLPDVAETFIFEHNDRLLFATGSGFYRLNPFPKADSSDVFIPDNSLIRERIGISHPVTDSRGNIWYVATYGKLNRYMEKLALQDDGSYLKVTRPFKRLPQQGFSKIYPDPVEQGMIWISGNEGLYRYNDNIEVDYDIPFNTLVRKVQTRDSLIFAGTYFDPSDTAMVPSMVLDQPEAFRPSLIYGNNQISFDFTATSYEVPEKNQYSYMLKGNEQVWSSWSVDTQKEYTNLSPGNYTFMVKSKNIYDTEGRTASYQFTILPPWWMTSWAYGMYVVLGLFLFWITSQINTYRIRLQRRKLKLIVADRTYEVMKQSKEIEKQNSILKEQKEEITQFLDDISEKNQELESSQEEILAINSRLKELNDHLEVQVDMRTKKIKSTLVQLRKTNKELDTFIYRASHDLKSPISRIMGLSTLAKLEMPDSMNKEYFDLIELAANDMKKLLAKLTQVHELLNKKLDIKEIDVPTLLGSIRESLKHLDRNGDTKYSFNIKDQLTFQSDEDIIRVIIENLVENAIIFRKEDAKESHHISIQLFKKDDKVNIVVRDNGIGIYVEHHDKLFDMFFRASDHSKGTGLGLYLVKMAVDNLHGSIRVSSKPDAFSEFTVQLPI